MVYLRQIPLLRAKYGSGLDELRKRALRKRHPGHDRHVEKERLRSTEVHKLSPEFDNEIKNKGKLLSKINPKYITMASEQDAGFQIPTWRNPSSNPAPSLPPSKTGSFLLKGILPYFRIWRPLT